MMKTLSLRGRLLVVTAALVALGLAVADGATFFLLRSSLIHRIDQQLLGSQDFAARFLGEASRGFPLGGFAFARRERSDAPVTYAAVLDASGETVLSRSFALGTVDPPALPSALPGAIASKSDEPAVLFTTRGKGRSLRYRVMAASLGHTQGTLVLAVPLTEVDATLRRLLLVEGGVTVGVIAAAVALALWLIRVGLRPLSRMEDTATQIAAGSLSRRVEPADEGTEVGRLGRALNDMLERLETAFAQREASERRLRRFVADASHELRTPLTSIRGYAELFRRGADARPDDLAKSMRRIEEESTRMGGLVDDLLLLARLDQGRPLEREPVDLVRVAADSVEDARVIERDRPIEFDAPESLIVQGDDRRLRQLVANLVNNALVHTPPGTPIHVRVAHEDGEAMLEVADEGPGLDPESAARVFDRFFRIDESRSRHGGGAGLGLSIVAAVAEAHGGRAWIDTAPGTGARFRVAFPAGTPADS